MAHARASSEKPAWGMLPPLPYGAVYFRKTNPPPEDWQRDIAQAAAEGMNVFRCWFLWGCIENRPGEFDWDDYDRIMDMSAQHGIKVIAAEMTTSVPLWLLRRRPDLFAVSQRGQVPTSGMLFGSASGNGGLICLDNPEARDRVEHFLTELARRYRAHEALLGYDVANEGGIHNLGVFHPDTFAAYRAWLKERYGSLDTLNRVWRRYSMADWEDVEPTDFPHDPLPESLDLWRFRRDHYYRSVQWKANILRTHDPDHLITAHGQPWFTDTDEWMFAQDKDVYGFTWVACRRGNAPWQQWDAVDRARGAAGGRPFWHAEAQGGPLWLQPQGPGRRPEDGRVASEEDIRLWNLVSLAAGARGILYTRWRGLLHPPLWDAFGLHNLDGTVNDRSEMASRIARWGNDPRQAGLMRASPRRGELAILHLPECITYHRMLLHRTPSCAGDIEQSLYGAYRGFFGQNLQPDWVEIEDLDVCRVVYLPQAIQMGDGDATRLKQWVHGGGTLIAEACPAYFDGDGAARQRQPGAGLDELFGVREAGVEFMPDLGHEICFEFAGTAIRGGLYRQVYAPTGGTSLGIWPDGRCAVAENRFGAGRTLLVGSFPSVGYFKSGGEENGAFFQAVAAWAGIEPAVRVSETSVIGRLHFDGERPYLWLVNMSAEAVDVRVEVRPEAVRFQSIVPLWGQCSSTPRDNSVECQIPGRDALVLELR